MRMIGAGVGLFLFGLSYLLKPIRQIDHRLAEVIQSQLGAQPWMRFFHELWFLGKSPFAVVFISYLILTQPGLGVSTALVYLVIAALERGLKLSLDRSRPFHALDNVRMNQPREPTDPSFPSGDSLRIWFLAALFIQTFQLPWPGLLMALILASSVTVGRIVMGVHYPSDTLAGAGLGLLAAESTLLLWQTLPLLRTFDNLF